MSKKRFPIREVYLVALMFLVALFISLLMPSVFDYFKNEELSIRDSAEHILKYLLARLESIQNYGTFMIGATLVSGLILLYQRYRKEILDRGIMACTLFFALGSVVFLINDPFITFYYDEYASATFFLSLVFVGFITTFFSTAGFVGVESEDKHAVNKASGKLLGVALICLVWSFMASYYEVLFFFYFSMPLIVWIGADIFFARRLGFKDTRWWTFKW
jgi:hypothetical protein